MGFWVARSKSIYVCNACGTESPKWLGKCPACGAWNSLVEKRKEQTPKGKNRERTFRLPDEAVEVVPQPLASLSAVQTRRTLTRIGEFDRVLGGGLVPGGLILVGGDPGIGKSTLLLQALERVAAQTADGCVLYVTGEESLEQVKLRADRLGLFGEKVLLFAETRTDRICHAIEKAKPVALVVDSVQSIYDPELESAPGTVSQIREVAAKFLYLAKGRGMPTFLVGHVTKDGVLAGPRLLEHMVDTVLYFESKPGQTFRILRAHKNRFGSTNEIGVFEMGAVGLSEVTNPSEIFLAERPVDAPGSVILPAIEGTRPVLVEVQALVSPSNLGTPRRTCLGFDNSRAALLVAVLERRAGLQLVGSDVFVNIVGGMNATEPATDLAVVAALASSFRNKPVPSATVVFGEVGLAGELRAVVQPELRLREAQKLGLSKAVLPEVSLRKAEIPKGMEVCPASTVDDALEALFG